MSQSESYHLFLICSMEEKMNIFGENGFFLNETSFQDLLFSKARVTRFTASLVELSPYRAREITLLNVNLNGKLPSVICIKLESFDSRTCQTNA